MKNETLKKLLFYTSKDALNKPKISEDETYGLFNKNIKHIYEKKYPISEKESIHPDWCLPEYITDNKGNKIDVFVEYWGIEGNDKYERIKNFKLPIYKRDKVTLVNIYAENDKKDISAALEWKLNPKNIKPYISNFEK